METKQEKNLDMTKCCKDCVVWEKFGKNCFYYWESKKDCTMTTYDWDEAAMRQHL